MSEKFKVGDRVRNVPTGSCALITAYNCSGAPVELCWEGEVKFYDHYTPEELRTYFERLCRNCGLSRQEHADNDKCLYGPGNWQ